MNPGLNWFSVTIRPVVASARARTIRGGNRRGEFSHQLRYTPPPVEVSAGFVKTRPNMLAATVVPVTAVGVAEEAGPGAGRDESGAPDAPGALDLPAPGAACWAPAQPAPSTSSAATAAALASDNVFMSLRPHGSARGCFPAEIFTTATYAVAGGETGLMDGDSAHL